MTASTQPSPALTATSALAEVLYDQLARHGAGASIGCLGAIAEFHEPAAQLALTANGLTASSARGALRVRLTGDERLYAYEAPSAHGDGWQLGLLHVSGVFLPVVRVANDAGLVKLAALAISGQHSTQMRASTGP